MKFKTLYKGNFLQVVNPVNIKEMPDYEVVHEPDGVIVFPILLTKKGIYTIIRKEFCPPYIIKSPEYKKWYTVISGTVDENELPEKCMLRELKEETGLVPIDYKIAWKQLYMPMYKGSDRRSSNYILLIKKFDFVPIKNDGTVGEELSSSHVIPLKNVKDIIKKPNCDFLLYSFYNIVLSELKKLKNLND